MLVICNGAPKSGSTWLYNILIRLQEFRWPADRYLTENSRKNRITPTIQPDLLKEFLDTEDHENVDWISKNHLGKSEHRTLLEACETVIVFDLERDIRDVIVSAYYDARNRNEYRGSFSNFYWRKGRRFAHHIFQYHQLWRDFGPRSYLSSYENLKQDFSGEVRRIASVLGQDIDDAQIAQIEAETSMDGLRDQYSHVQLYEGERFFRKGEIGDWANHLDARMCADLERISATGEAKTEFRVMLERARSAFLSRP